MVAVKCESSWPIFGLFCTFHFLCFLQFRGSPKSIERRQAGENFFQYSRPVGEAVIWLHEISLPTLASVVLDRGFGMN
jgi:hypothetical protein